MEESPRTPAGAIQLAGDAPEKTRACPWATDARTAKAASAMRDILVAAGRACGSCNQERLVRDSRRNNGTTERRKPRTEETQTAADTSGTAAETAETPDLARGDIHYLRSLAVSSAEWG